MADMMSEEDRSYTMSQIRSTGTEPEDRLRGLLEEFFGEYKLREHPDDLPGTPDFWLPELDLAVFADGCFFHKCPDHFTMPKSNQDYWKPKLERNKERDREVDEALRQKGITPVRIWEHDLKDDLNGALNILRSAIKSAES